MEKEVKRVIFDSTMGKRVKHINLCGTTLVVSGGDSDAPGGVELPTIDRPAEPSDIRLGKEVINADGEKVEGTMPEHIDGSTTLTITEPTFKVKEGYHSGCHVGVNARDVTKAKALKDETVIVRDENGAFMATVEIEPAADVYNDGYDNGYVEGHENGITEGREAGYADGYNDGEVVARTECERKYFETTIIGDGGTELVVPNVSFRPDCISIYGTDPKNLYNEHTITLCIMDLKTFGYLGGMSCALQTSVAYTTQGLLSATMNTRCPQDENGTLTITNLQGSTTSSKGKFLKGARYVVTATKYTDKTDKEYLDEYISSLGDTGGKITLSKGRVNSVYPNASAGTNEEWEKLIKEKIDCGWTIALM